MGQNLALGITKSTIQIALERAKVYDAYINECKNLSDQYEIENSVFVFNGRNLDECVTGYFVPEDSSDTPFQLRSIIEELKRPAMRIHQLGNKPFFTAGELYENFSDIPEDTPRHFIYEIAKRKNLD